MSKKHERGNPTDKTSKNKSSADRKQDEAQQHSSQETALDVLIQRARENPHLLNTSDIIHLQRTLGNSAVSRLLPARPISRKALHTGLRIQLKPANIDNTYTMNYDSTGKFTNVAAPRTRGLKRPLVINAQLKDGWVLPHTPVMGAHLFKAEFGGPDNETNVVPWIQTSEDLFSIFENEYKAAADSDAKAEAAKNNPFTATVKTNATFVDRPDLEVTDTDLDTAGWPTGDVKRQERKDKYADVAERFSGIPTSLRVEVSGITGGPKIFAPTATQISPTYAKNPEAVKPAYVVPTRFVRNGTEPRLFPRIPDWTAFKKAKAKDPGDVAKQKKLNHIAGRHKDHFGIPGNSMADLETLETFIGNFIGDITKEQILGTYMGKDVLHYVDNATRLWVCTTPTGELIAGFQLSTGQYDILINRGTVG